MNVWNLILTFEALFFYLALGCISFLRMPHAKRLIFREVGDFSLEYSNLTSLI